MSDKKPFLKVEGEWNGVMYSKNTSGVSSVRSLFQQHSTFELGVMSILAIHCGVNIYNNYIIYNFLYTFLFTVPITLHWNQAAHPNKCLINALPPSLPPSLPQEQEVFMDTVNTPTIRKKLRKLSAQDPGESRRRWQRVTEALQQRDIDTATDEKHQVRVGVCVGGEGL